MISFKDYSARIAYLKSISKYHFDPFEKNESSFQILGRFAGLDWFSEVSALEKEARGGSNFNFDKALDYGQGKKRLNLQFDLKLTGDKSYNPEHVFLNRIEAPLLCREKAPTIFKMADWFALEPETLDVRIHIQHPGQVFPIHVDGLSRQRISDDKHEKMQVRPEEWGRFQVQLQDWVWGHMWAMGNQYWSQWRAGEIMYFHWWDIPHATANAGFAPRYSMQVTGILTETTKERLKNHHAVIDLNSL